MHVLVGNPPAPITAPPPRAVGFSNEVVYQSQSAAALETRQTCVSEISAVICKMQFESNIMTKTCASVEPWNHITSDWLCIKLKIILIGYTGSQGARRKWNSYWSMPVLLPFPWRLGCHRWFPPFITCDNHCHSPVNIWKFSINVSEICFAITHKQIFWRL